MSNTGWATLAVILLLHALTLAHATGRLLQSLNGIKEKLAETLELIKKNEGDSDRGIESVHQRLNRIEDRLNINANRLAAIEGRLGHRRKDDGGHIE